MVISMKLLGLAVIFLFAISLRAEEPLTVNVARVECLLKSEECEETSKSLRFLQRSYADIEHLKRVVRLYVLNEGIQSFDYSLVEEKGGLALNIKVGLKRELLSYEIRVKGKEKIELPAVLPLREGDYIDAVALEKTKETLTSFVQGQGYPEASVSLELQEKKHGATLTVHIEPGTPVIIESIETWSDSPLLAEMARKRLSSFAAKSFHLREVNNAMEELRQRFVDYGYYLNELDLEFEIDAQNKAFLKVSIKSNDLHVFHPTGNEAISTSEIKSALKSATVVHKRRLSRENVAARLRAMYAEKGFVGVNAQVVESKYKNSDRETVNRYDIKIEEGARTQISKTQFIGNSAVDSKLLTRIFYERAPDVVKSGYFQKVYFENFVEAIREVYITRGFVNVIVDEPRVRFLGNQAFLTYRVREGAKAAVSQLRFEGVPAELEAEFLEIIDNKPSSPFNPVTFKRDLEMIENRLKQQGYYFAAIKNKNDRSIVSYKNDNSAVDLNIDIDLGERLVVDQIIIVGNRKTRSRLIKRAMDIKPGDLVTREAVQRSQTNLLGLGIFSSALIDPIPGYGGKSDILVSVREKDFGLVELAPGVRTDIGLKLSANVSYNNLDGLNKRVSFKGQVNQRFNLNSLDERRRNESSSLVEYDLAVNYSENYFLKSDVGFSASLSSSRKRFFSFDADIQRFNFTFSKEFAPWLSVSLRPQFETIEQFDATSERDEGTFRIGSLTPSVTLDFRNNRINPTSGSWFNMSLEVANPALLSQEVEGAAINYYKFISRNRFYIPYERGTLAMSLSAGVEENLAVGGEGYIPNIKVFRLNGADIVRGFEDDEINRLINGSDISEMRVDRKAYMAVIKVEPRIFLSDTSMIGLFYDAGRVFVDSFDASELRSSVGVSFKYLTPVGSLDFDYGIKLLRKTYDDGMVDSPGRLHVSIGFF